MPDEVELKLALRERDADLLAESNLLGGEPRKARQKSLYFDTPDHALAEAGLSLRIRRSGGKRVQTVKAYGGSSAGLFVRPEWEKPVRDDKPVIDDSTPIRALLGEVADRLVPVFEIHIERHSWDVHEGDASIELVLDRGEVVAGDRRSSICEVELELKDGDDTALIAFAHKLDAIAPVRLGALTKAERGYALLDPAVTAVKAEPVELRRDMSVAEAVQHIVQVCLRQFRLNEDLFIAAQTPEALHQARVALRRLRSALSIFKGLFADEASARLRNDLRKLAAELGEARSIDALIARAPPGALRGWLETARQIAYAYVRDVLLSPETRGLMLDLTQWNASGAWLDAAHAAELRDRPLPDFACAALDRLRRKVRKSGRYLDGEDDRARHELRKKAKRLRYAAEFFAALFDRKRERREYRRFVSALERLQEELGVLNDRVTAPEILARVGISAMPDAVDDLFPDSKAKLIDAAGRAHARLLDADRFWR